jgi:hypothetical protein
MNDRVKIYIGAPGFTPSQREVIDQIKQFLDDHSEHFVYYAPFDFSSTVFQGKPPKEATKEQRQRVFEENATRISFADLFVGWVGGLETVYKPINIVKEYTSSDDGRVEGTFRPSTSAFTDLGVGWEMGGCHLIGTPVLAYFHDTDDSNVPMNLMLELGVQGVCKGFGHLVGTLMEVAEKGVPNLLQTLESEAPVNLEAEADPVV